MKANDHDLTPEHEQFCVTDMQREVLRLSLAGSTSFEIAKILDRAPGRIRSIRSAIRRAARRYGLDPATGATAVQYLPVTGQSVLTRKVQTDGGLVDEEVLRWTKTCRATEDMMRDVRIAIAAMAEDILPLPPLAAPKEPGLASLMNLHVLTDYHLGMFAAARDGGTAWSSEEAEAFLTRWFALSIASAPQAKTGLLLQLGDFFHFDGINPVTPESGHVLDADSRYADVVSMGVRCLRRIVTEMLGKYEEVVLVISEGNHDISSSIWMREMLAVLYGEEPRVVVDTSPSPYHAYEFGNTAIFAHHGHRRPPAQVDQVLAAIFRPIYGRCEHSYAHLGHRHSRELKESNLMIVEQHATMAPKDAYSSSRGYTSRRTADVVTYHRQYGEVGRLRINAEMLER